MLKKSGSLIYQRREEPLRLENTGELGVTDKDQLTLKTDERGEEETKCEDVENKPLADPKITDQPSDDQRTRCTKVMNGEVQLYNRPHEDAWRDAHEQYPEPHKKWLSLEV